MFSTSYMSAEDDEWLLLLHRRTLSSTRPCILHCLPLYQSCGNVYNFIDMKLAIYSGHGNKKKIMKTNRTGQPDKVKSNLWSVIVMLSWCASLLPVSLQSVCLFNLAGRNLASISLSAFYIPAFWFCDSLSEKTWEWNTTHVIYCVW